MRLFFASFFMLLSTQLYADSSSSQQKSKMLPDISAILDTSYVDRSIDGSTKNIDEGYQALSMPGFSKDTHGIFNGKEGFNLNGIELILASTVDPYFDLFSALHITETGIEVEEAYVTTRRVPYGFQFKVGKFLSHFGRVNAQHQHSRDFSDATLMQAAFFGEEGLRERGVQMNWVAPTSSYWLFGMEVLQGENGNSFGVDSIETDIEEVDAVSQPNLVVGLIETSYDWGNWVFLGGLSMAQGQARSSYDFGHEAHEEDDHDDDEHEEEDDHDESASRVLIASDAHGHGEETEEDDDATPFAGSTRLTGIDLTLRYYWNAHRYISWQSEFVNRRVDGRVYQESMKSSFDRDQDGLYTQFIVGLTPSWRTGVRYDQLSNNEVTLLSEDYDVEETLTRNSLMVEYNPSEFSRIRFQVNQDDSKFFGDERMPIQEFVVQFNMAIGPHAAHLF